VQKTIERRFGGKLDPLESGLRLAYVPPLHGAAEYLPERSTNSGIGASFARALRFPI